MKKLVLTILIFLLVILVAGCGGSSDGTWSPQPSPYNQPTPYSTPTTVRIYNNLSIDLSLATAEITGAIVGNLTITEHLDFKEKSRDYEIDQRGTVTVKVRLYAVKPGATYFQTFQKDLFITKGELNIIGVSGWYTGRSSDYINITIDAI